MTYNLSIFRFQFSPPSARHYHSALSIWLSVDPMADKYPGVSPYAYCANNPVKLVDPNGREIGEYYDWYGNYLGWDGVDDDNVYIVSGRIPQKNIDKSSHIVTSLGKANIDVSTTKSVIREAIAVYERTVDNGGNYEECSAFDCDGKPFVGKRGDNGKVHSPLEEGSVSIHSHNFIETRDKNNIVEYCTPEFPSIVKMCQDPKCDETSFLNFDLNIIVGKLAPDEFQTRVGAMTFYGRIITNSKGDLLEQPYIGTMLMDDARKIINHK